MAPAIEEIGAGYAAGALAVLRGMLHSHMEHQAAAHQLVLKLSPVENIAEPSMATAPPFETQAMSIAQISAPMASVPAASNGVESGNNEPVHEGVELVGTMGIDVGGENAAQSSEDTSSGSESNGDAPYDRPEFAFCSPSDDGSDVEELPVEYSSDSG